MSEVVSELDVANAATTTADTGAGTETTPADGAAPAVAPAVPTPEPAAPAINWNDPEILNRAAEAIQRMGYVIAPNQPEAPAVQVDPEYDPFDKASVDAYIAAKLEASTAPISEQLAQINATIQAQHAAETVDLVNTRIELAIDAAGLQPAEGQTHDQLHTAVNALANALAAPKLATLNAVPVYARAAEAQKLGDAAITEAVSFFNTMRTAAAAQGAQGFREDLARDGSHLLEPGIRGAGVEGATPAVSEADVARRFMDARRA